MALASAPMAAMPQMAQAPLAAPAVAPQQPGVMDKAKSAALKFGANAALDAAMPGLGTFGGGLAQAVMPAFFKDGGSVAAHLQPQLPEHVSSRQSTGQLSLPKSFIQYDMAPIMGYLPGPLGMKDMTDMAKANGAGKLAGIEYKRQGGKVPTQHVSMKFHGPMAPKPSGE